MRNLKKVLSLSLALVMLLGMMVVGAGAAEYTDAGEIEYKEAADVLTAIGVMQGRDNGSFDPKAELDRAEGAAIIYRMLTGGMTQNPSTASTGFVDVDGVANYSWASGIIADLANKGIVAGEDATHFNPSGKLNGYAFGKMLLVALGYNAQSQGYVGGGWEGNVIRDAYGRNITVDGVIMSNNITREQAAQMSLNTLQATMVVQQGGIQIGDVVIPGDRATDMQGSASKNYDNQSSGDSLTQFCEAYFPTLTLNTSADDDDFGHAKQEWKVGKEVVATVPAVADLTYTAKTKDDDIEKALKSLGVVADSTGIKSTTNGTLAGSEDIKGTTLALTADTIATKTGNGTKVEIYIDKSTDKIERVIVTTYTVEKVKNVVEKDDATTYTFTTTSGSFKNDEDATNCVVAGAVEKDDVVTTVKIGDKIYVYPTDSFTGNQTARKTSSGQVTITVSGESYKLGHGVTGIDPTTFVNSDKDATYYVDQFDFVILVEDIEVAAPEYAMIVDAVGTETNATLDSATGYTANVRAVLADGTVQDFALALRKSGADGTASSGDYLYAGKVSLDDTTAGGYNVQTKLTANVKGKVMAYTLNDDEEMVLEGLTAASSGMTVEETYSYTNGTDAYKAETSNTHSSATALFNSKTVFVLYSVDGKKVTAEAPVTGVANLKIDTTSGVATNKLNCVISATSASRGTASVVFLEGAIEAVEKNYVYVDKTEDNLVGKNYEYTGKAVDGTDVDVWKKDSKVGTSGLYEYNVETGELGSAVTPDSTPNTSTAPTKGEVYADVSATKDGEMLLVGKSWINISETPVTYIARGVDEITNGCKLLIVMDSASNSKIAGIYVTAAAPVGIGATASKTSTTIEKDATDDIVLTIPTLDGGVTVTPTAASNKTSVATVGAWDSTNKKFTITGVAAGTATVTITLTPSDTDAYNVQTIAVTVTVKDDVSGSYAPVNKTDVTAAAKTAASTFTFTKPGTVTENITAADFDYATKGNLPAGIASVTYDATGNATVTGSADTSGATITVTVTPKANTDAAKYFKATDITITITALTGTWV